MHRRRPYAAIAALTATLALAGTSALPTVARACKCAPPSASAVTRPFIVEGAAALRAGPDEVALACRGTRAIACTWRSEHVYRNPSDAPAPVVLIVATTDARELAVTINGAAASPRETAGESRQQLAGRLADVRYADPDAYRHISTVAATLPPGASRVTLEAMLEPEAHRCACGFSGSEARHPVVTGLSDISTRVRLDRVLGAPRDPDATVTMRVTAPAWWSGFARTEDARYEDLTRRRATITRGVESDAIELGWELRRWVLPGGPLIGVGGGLGDGSGLRLRAGYEFAAPRYVVYSLAVESDAKSHVELIPAIEGVPPWGAVLSLFPMPSLGVGAPIQVWPETRAGVRAQLGLGWYVVTLLLALDVFPAVATGPRLLRGGIMAQFSM